jgi:HK97 family phage major capsid protein
MDLNDLKKDRAKKLDEARAIHAKAEAENRELNENEQKQFDGLMVEVNAFGTRIIRQEMLMNQEAGIKNPITGDPTQLATNRDGKPEYKNLGEMLCEIRYNRSNAESRLLAMGAGGTGGFLIPDQFKPDLLSLKPEEAIVRPRATVIPAGEPPDALITMPALSQGTAGVYAGVTVTWIGEGDTKPETTPVLEEVTLEPSEVAAHVIVTDKLLRNAAAASGIITKLLRDAVIGAEDYAFLRGNGTGKPQGVISATGTATVTRNTGATFLFADVANMLTKLQPDSLGNAVWVLNQSVMPKLIQMVDVGNHTVWFAGDITKGIPPSLVGIPVHFTGRTPVLGTQGDVLLADFRYYLIKDGSGPFVDASPHVYFTTNKTVIKIFWNVDGDCWVKAPLTLEDATTTVSPYVVLV